MTMDQRDILCALGLFETRWIIGNRKTSPFEDWITIYTKWAENVHRYNKQY